MATQNKTLVFAKVPSSVPVPGEHLIIESREIDLSAAPPEGGLVVRNLYASFDPYQRGCMREPSLKSYVPAYQVGSAVTNSTIARVVKSDSADFSEGELVSTRRVPIAEYAVIERDDAKLVRKVNNPHNLDAAHFLGALGMPGLTAYSSLYAIGKPVKGETIFVSSAAGAVGQVVGQLAKREGLRVLGSVGSDEKLEFITRELGFDGGFNYKKEQPADALKRLAPDGIDIYYDNVGGELLEASIGAMKDRGRIVECGQISGYNTPPDKRYGVKNLFMMVTKQLLMQGFLVHMLAAPYREEHQEKVQQWLADGSMVAKLSITDGIDKAAEGFVGMLKGENFGKAVLKIVDL